MIYEHNNLSDPVGKNLLKVNNIVSRTRSANDRHCFSVNIGYLEHELVHQREHKRGGGSER